MMDQLSPDEVVAVSKREWMVFGIAHQITVFAVIIIFWFVATSLMRGETKVAVQYALCFAGGWQGALIYCRLRRMRF